ncbi:MAG TPA: hypothetical protein VEZ71_11985 [Archangium sp.]|nr:hypothetical protein [Archangium sp.]
MAQQESPPVHGEVPASAPNHPGTWTQQDREQNAPRWQQACAYNLTHNNNKRYTRIVERRDFYRWFYIYTIGTQHHTTRWALAAHAVAQGAGAVANMLPGLEQGGTLFNTVSNELQGMMREGNQVIFDNVFPKLRELFLSSRPLTGRQAFEWDMRILSEEQTLIQPLYQGVSRATFNMLEAIARQRGLPGYLSGWFEESRLKSGDHIREGAIPPFTFRSLTSIDDRWRYGMTLGNQFTPGGTGFDPARHTRPQPGPGYTTGAELRRVRTRSNLHRLDAVLDDVYLFEPQQFSVIQGMEIAEVLQRLTPTEQAEFLRDETPNGNRYSSACYMVKSRDMLRVLGTFEVGLEAQLRFALKFVGDDRISWLMVGGYNAIRPIVLAFKSQAFRLRTPEWQRIFTIICDDASMAQAVTDLGFPAADRTRWIEGERGWW